MKHSVDLLDEALELATQIGFEVRREWLGERVGGACRLGDRWILFSDLSLTADEQLRQTIAALRNSHLLAADYRASPELRRLLE
jgi:hypothetical protein